MTFSRVEFLYCFFFSVPSANTYLPMTTSSKTSYFHGLQENSWLLGFQFNLLPQYTSNYSDKFSFSSTSSSSLQHQSERQKAHQLFQQNPDKGLFKHAMEDLKGGKNVVGTKISEKQSLQETATRNKWMKLGLLNFESQMKAPEEVRLRTR